MTLASADRIVNTGGSPDNLKTGSDRYNAHKHERLYNHVFNSDVETWGSGTTSAPTGWTLTGAGATIAKNTTAGQFKVGAASAAVTRVGTDCYLGQTVDTISGQGPVGWWQSKEVTLGCWVRATVASRARIAIYDGVGTTYSDYHTGGSSLEFLTVTRTLDAAATEVTVRLYVDTGNTTAQFDGAILVIGPDVDDWQPSGWRGRKAVLMFGNHSTGLSVGTTYQLNTAAAHAAGAETDAQIPVPFKGVARNLQVMTGTTPVNPNTNIFTLRKNTANTSLTATVTDVVNPAADNTNEVEFAKADKVNLQIAVGSTATTGVNGTIEYEEIP